MPQITVREPEPDTPAGFTELQHAILTARDVPAARGGRMLLWHTWRRTGLDPFTGQIYLAARDGRLTVETTIDGFRSLAEAHGQYAGQDGPWWCGADGIWHDVWTQERPPWAAKLSVLRHDFTQPVTAVARFADYAAYTRRGVPDGMPARLTHFWAKMGPLMTAKCAEALALRRAFPQVIGGLYTSDEMQQSGGDAGPAHSAPQRVTVAHAAAQIEAARGQAETLRTLWMEHHDLLTHHTAGGVRLGELLTSYLGEAAAIEAARAADARDRASADLEQRKADREYR